jgi:AcrR family transcriptional regulator
MASILDAAEMVMAEVGYDEANTNRIAAQAGISPGSLYHFFANKEEIAHALAERYRQELQAIYRLIYTEAALPAPLEVWLEQILHALVVFHLAHPAFKVIFSSTPQAEHLTGELDTEVRYHFEQALHQRGPQLSQIRVTRLTQMSIQMLKAILPFALRADEAEREDLLGELRQMLFSYLDSALTDAAIVL